MPILIENEHLWVFQWCCLADQGYPSVTQHVVSVESSFLLLHSVLKKCDLFVNRDD